MKNNVLPLNTKITETNLYYYKVHLKFLLTHPIPLYQSPTDEVGGERTLLTQEVFDAAIEQGKNFYIEKRTQREIQKSCERLAEISRQIFIKEIK